jgi:hypothetical protein
MVNHPYRWFYLSCRHLKEVYQICAVPWTLPVGRMDGNMGYIYVELEELVSESILTQPAHILGIPPNFNHPARDELINAEAVRKTGENQG